MSRAYDLEEDGSKRARREEREAGNSPRASSGDRTDASRRYAQADPNLYNDSLAGGGDAAHAAHLRQAGQTSPQADRGVQRAVQRFVGNLPVQREETSDKSGPDSNAPRAGTTQPGYSSGEGLQLNLQTQAMARAYLLQNLDGTRLRYDLLQLHLGTIPMPSAAQAASSSNQAGQTQQQGQQAQQGQQNQPQPSSVPPMALQPAPTAPPTPLVPVGKGPATPRPAEGSDLMEAVMSIPQIEQALQTLREQATDHLDRQWGRLNTGERLGVVSSVLLIGGGALGGAMSQPESRDWLLNQLNGRVLPVPGVEGLHVEVNTQGGNLMMGVHLDVGRFLPESLGFGPGSPSPIGGPPTQRAVQRSAAGGRVEEEPQIGRRIEAAAGGGSGLDEGTKGKLEAGLGADLSGVRVHTDGEADSLSRSVDAVAFTTGQDIFFRQGAYNPSSPEGMKLLAHEATHTVQQSQGPVSGTPSPGGVSISDPSDSFERAAEKSAEVVASGRTGVQRAPEAGADLGVGVQRQADPREEDEDDNRR